MKKQNLLNRLKKWIKLRPKTTITMCQINDSGSVSYQAANMIITVDKSDIKNKELK